MNKAPLSSHDLDPESLRSRLPEAPGVYIFKDSSDQIIYVGKAKNLRKRVLAYFKPPEELPHKTALMMNRARGLEHLLTATEKEAFILEDTLVKRHMPRYNIVLRDDKRYPCLRLDVQNPFPRLTIVRRIKKDGALYFGPFSSANSVRSTLKLIDRLFHLRKCKGRDLPKRARPCLNYQLGRCLGACVHKVSSAAYREVVQQVKLFLQGRNQELIGQLKKRMAMAAQELDFERAARIRDQIRAVEATIERQHVVSPRMEDQDVIGGAKADGRVQLVVLFVRKGSLVGSREYVFRDRDASLSEVMEAFLKQYYGRESFIPKYILISEPVEELAPLSDWISDLAGKRVWIRRPARGEKLRLVRMAVTNAQNLLSTRQDVQKEDLMTLSRSVLRLEKPPRVMEGIDVSNLHGNQAVGTIVSFVDGLPHRSGYRNFRIRGMEGVDDYAMISQVVSRRLSKGNPPDLFVVDGGKGHLAAVERAMKGFSGMELPRVVGIAKADERKKGAEDKIYVLGRKNPLPLKSDHPVLLLLMRIRDEAHRRAITYHRKLRGRPFKGSELDQIPGIGPNKRRLLLAHFGDLERLSKARLEDLTLLPGISESLAKKILTFFSERNMKGAT